MTLSLRNCSLIIEKLVQTFSASYYGIELLLSENTREATQVINNMEMA